VAILKRTARYSLFLRNLVAQLSQDVSNIEACRLVEPAKELLDLVNLYKNAAGDIVVY
jgi:hypothetical protein